MTGTQHHQILMLDSADNVAVALGDLVPGSYPFNGQIYTLAEPVARKHKFLTKSLKKGDKVIMYGVPVGHVLIDLPAGSVLTTDNVRHFAASASLDKRALYSWEPPDVSPWQERTFMGYHRSDGRVGTANYWLFVPLVFCENRNLKAIEDALTRTLGYHRGNTYEQLVRQIIAAPASRESQAARYFKNIDGIKFLYHQGGCGGTRQDAEMLLRLLVGYVNHPNVAGATILSLGCQHAQVSWYQQIQEALFPKSTKTLIFIEQQQLKTEEMVVRTAIEKTLEALHVANQTERQPAPLHHLTIGLECGGSDGFSGISANPAVGHASDLVVALGGSAILSEFPELNGVEQNLVDRCVDTETGRKFMDLQTAYEKSAQAAGSGFDMNPSPGNIRDGLITDAMKSAGAAKKGGKAPVADVLDYAEPVRKKGLHLLCTPGNDVESTTGLAGSGANVILFTTGLGTPTGNPIVPTIKISTNTELFQAMNDIIDVDAGTVIRGEKTIADVGEDILEEIIAVASGKETKAMRLDQNDFIPWKRGVSL